LPKTANTTLSRYDAVLLDIDGTLVDSNAAHAAAWSDAFKAHGRHHPPEQVLPLIGKGGDKLLRELASLDDGSGEGKRIAEARLEIFRNRYLSGLKPTPGAAAFVEWLLESRMTVVVATSAKDDEVKALLTICGGQELLKDATTSDDAERSKPDPDILVAALQKSGFTPDRAIMIGDTPYDIEAASRARLATIAFRCGGWDDASLRGAIAIYDHPRQLLDRLAQSPFCAKRSKRLWSDDRRRANRAGGCATIAAAGRILLPFTPAVCTLHGVTLSSRGRPRVYLAVISAACGTLLSSAIG
jgi:HAD superfamily hydrolase (TIGR01509 family)